MDEYMQAQMEKIVDDLESGNQMEEHHHIEPARENYQEYRQASDYSYPTGESEEQSNSEETKYNILEVYEDEMEVQKSLEIYPFYSCHEEQHHEEQHHEEQHREEQHHEEMANSEWQGSQYAMDSVPPSPHRSPYASFISADIDDDWSDRDLIPIPFKSSSRLSTEGYSPVINSEESTSSRRNSLKSRLSISLPKSPRSPHSPFSGTLPAISHQSSKLFASSQTFYGEKTPYTSAAATPVHEKSFFIEESDSVHQQRNDFLAFTDYTFGRSLLSEQQGSSLSASEMENEDETDWDTSMALERLRGQSASMLFAQIAESHANEKTTRTIHTQNTSTWDVVSESEMLMSGPVSPINNVLPDTYEWSQREVPPDLFSGHVSPRTPVARGMTYNLTDEIGLAKENYKAEQRASLSLVQPLMAAATLLEAQLDLSKGRLFKRRASPNLQANTFVNKETSFSSSTVTEPWHNVGGVYSEKEKEEDYIEEAFTAYFDESIMKEAQMKLLELTSLPKKDYAEDDKEISESLFFSCEPVSMAALARTENESAEATYNSDTSNKSFSVTSPTEATVEHPVKEWGLSYSDMWSSENAGQHSALFEERMAELLNPGKKENTSRTKASATRFTIETRADKSFREEKNGFSFGAFGSPDSSTSPWTLMDAPETSTTIESHSTMTLATPVLLQGSYNEGAGQDLPLTASLHSHDDNVKELVSSYSHTKSEQKILEPEITESTEYHLVKSEPCEESTIIFDSSLYSVDEVVNCQTVDLEEMKIDNVLNPTFAVTKEMEMIETEDSRDFIDTKEYEENEVVKEILSRSISTKETEEVEITEETTRKSIDIKETEKIEVVKEISDISTDIKETKETKIEKAFSIPTSVIEVGDVSAKASTNIIEVEEMAAEDVSTKTYANIIEVEEMAAEDVSSRDCIDMEETEEIVMEETEETKVFETEKTSRGISITLQETEVLEVTETEDISRRISIDIEDIEMIDECSSTKEFTDIKETEEIEVYGISSVGSIDTKEAVEIQVIKSQDILRRESIDIEDIVVIEVQDIPTTRSIQVEEIQVEQAQVEQAPIHVLSNEESTVITETEYQEEELSSTVYEVIYETIQVDSIDMDNSDAVLGVRASTINTSQSIPSTQRVVTRERPSRRLSFQSARNVINNLPSMESTLSRESVMSYDSISSVVTCIPDTEATEATGATGATGATSQESNEGYSNILMRTIQDPRVTLDEVSVTVESASDRDLRETIEAYVHTHSRVSTSEDYESEQIHSESSSQGQGTRISRGTLSTRGSSKDGTESEHSGAFGSLVYVSANESNNDMMSVSSGVDSIDWHSATGSMDFVEVEAQDGDEDEAETDARVAQWVMDEIDSPSIHRLERSRSRDHLLYRYFQRQQLTSDAGTCRTDSLDKLHVYDSEEEGSVGSDKTAT
ncbi:hypothetical protein BDF14DRAFT_1777807 [Spinellus fusiger]|nr:hypothetical protein BDF14DRAFT_1777807 [Spinellus fusiger]